MSEEVLSTLHEGDEVSPISAAEAIANVDAALKRALVSDYLFPPRSSEEALERYESWDEIGELLDEVIGKVTSVS